MAVFCVQKKQACLTPLNLSVESWSAVPSLHQQTIANNWELQVDSRLYLGSTLGLFDLRSTGRQSYFSSGCKPLSHSSFPDERPSIRSGRCWRLLTRAEQQTSGDCPCATCLHMLENAAPQIIWVAGRAAWVGDYRRLHTAVKDISSTWLSGCGRGHPEGGRRHMGRKYIYVEGEKVSIT